MPNFCEAPAKQKSEHFSGEGVFTHGKTPSPEILSIFLTRYALKKIGEFRPLPVGEVRKIDRRCHNFSTAITITRRYAA